MSYDNDNQLDTALQNLRQWYYKGVRALADAVIDAVKNGEIKNEEELDQYVHESVDGHAFVIYTFKAKAALLASDYEDAYDTEMGDEGGPYDPSVRAYFALRADVMEQIEGARRQGELFPKCEECDDTMSVTDYALSKVCQGCREDEESSE